MSRSIITMNALFVLALFVSVQPAAAAAAISTELQPETINAWEAYVRSADSGLRDRVEGKTPFLWMDESADRKQRVVRGEIVVAPAISHGTLKVHNGLIHHWVGGIFIPGATLESVAAVIQNYDGYKNFYKPVVVDSKLLDGSPLDQRFWMIWQHKVLFVTAAIEGQYQAHSVRVDLRRAYDIADSVQVQEIENYGRAGQRFLPPGTGNGYIWRLHSIARYEQRDGGVALELEAIALTRDIPVSVRWLVNPIVNRLSTSSLETTLQQTRDAVMSANRLALR